MGTFIRAVVTGFGFSLGSAIFKKVSKRLGLNEDAKNDLPPDAAHEAAEGGEGEDDGGSGDDGDGEDGGGAAPGDGDLEQAPS